MKIVEALYLSTLFLVLTLFAMGLVWAVVSIAWWSIMTYGWIAVAVLVAILGTWGVYFYLLKTGS